MRTTVTLDPDADALLRRRMRDRGISFKDALNEAVRAGLAPRGDREFRTPTADLGLPSVKLDRALALAGELEDAELLSQDFAGGKSL